MPELFEIVVAVTLIFELELLADLWQVDVLLLLYALSRGQGSWLYKADSVPCVPRHHYKILIIISI